MRVGRVLAILALSSLLVVPVAGVAQEYVSGASTAELSVDPEFPGYWRYCIEMEWDVTDFDGYGMSHIDVFLGLENCTCVCAPGYFAFADTVGSGPGTPNGSPCTIYYYGMFSCDGDPTIPDGVPLIKFEYYEDTCEPDKIGSATLCFYSVAVPTPAGTFVDALGIKFGPEFAKGDLTGVLPSCDDAYSAVEPSTWGTVKALYR